MFEKTLTDVVKGIRASKRDTALYISQCIAEIKTEINSSDMYVKANALQKLTFLQMMGYSTSWANFASIEVMSSPRFAHKRIGYLAASQGFTQDTDVVLLTTNLLKKELRGAMGGGMTGVYEAGLAVNCISNIVTEDLASDVLSELTSLTIHTQPYIRKKAILCLFKVFVKYPQGLRLSFEKLQKCLSDSNASVVSCAVNVITELSDKNPKNYLHLAPAFFDLLTQSSNNWMLIKVVKLLGSLVPEEPRLARKLLEPLAAIVRNTQAKSLLYEAVHTITLCLPYCRKNDGSMPANVPDIVVLCAQILRTFVEESDQNLKYLGLVGFGSLMQSHPRVLSAPDYRPLILACLSDQDVTIRTRALDLLKGMASPKNLVELVTQLLRHVENATGNYKLDLVAKIIDMCSGEKYALLHDFSWYMDVLFQLGRFRGIERHANLIRSQIVDVALRVLPIRAYAVHLAMNTLIEGEIRHRTSGHADNEADLYGDNGRGKHIMVEICPGVAWIIGEYADLIEDALGIRDDDISGVRDVAFDSNSKGPYHAMIQALTEPSSAGALATYTQGVYVQAAMKVFAAATVNPKLSREEVAACVFTLRSNLPFYMQSVDVEVVERACTSFELLSSLTFIEVDSSAPSARRDEGSNATLGDLLGLQNGSSSPPDAASLPQQTNVENRTLSYLLKPSPMKPVGAKSQRKKCATPSASVAELERPLDLSCFEFLLEEEEVLRSSLKSLESVSFTQQHPRLVQAPVPALAAFPQGTDVSSRGTPNGVSPVSAGSSFQKATGNTNTPSSQQIRQDDPFYLGTSPAPVESTQQDRADSRFGTIQLLDSDDENPRNGSKPKRKKDKKVKSTSAKLKGGMPLQTAVTVYESDDEDSDDLLRMTRGSSAISARRKGPSKEFEGLAKVDLTTPLREDEIMPERRHRVVPDRMVKEKRNDKKEKKTKKNKKQSLSAGATVGDLLGLEGFAVQATTSAATGISGASSDTLTRNPVNEAFDDLLGLTEPNLTYPPTAEAKGLASQLRSPPVAESENLVYPDLSLIRNTRKYSWLQSNMKLSSASGSPSCDWSKLAMLYRVEREGEGGNASVFIVFRFENLSALDITNLSISLQNQWKAAVGDIPAGSIIESERLGPIPYLVVDTSQDCKGLLTSSGSQVSIKLSLPSSVFLNPEPDVSIETAASELSSGPWTSHSVRVRLSSNLNFEEVKSAICMFLNAAEVHKGETGASSSMLAASSSKSGARIRALVKMKANALKVDIRCTSSSLGESLVSDIKRLQID